MSKSHKPESAAALRLLIPLLVMPLVVAACATPRFTPAGDATGLTHCSDPRPQICTMDYVPVCALRVTDTRCIAAPCSSGDWVQYPNACSACADKQVRGYLKGECQENQKR